MASTVSADVASNAYVALLRGINVGGKNIVAMKSLKASFEKLGFDDVSTYINSGNILFRSGEKDPRKLETRIDRMLTRDYGLKPATVVRSYAEMRRLQKSITKHWQTADPDWRYNVMFLRHAIDSKQLLDDLAVKPDIETVVYCPGTLLWRARVRDLTRTAMVKIASKPVYKQMTIRNLNTTNKLIELLERMNRKV
jgi:uncharacterized protein (DUF1697 family)